jgi:Flp pilus assembly protein TadB
MIGIALLGAGVGAGLWLIYSALAPPPLPLRVVVAQLTGQVKSPKGGGRLDERVGRATGQLIDLARLLRPTDRARIEQDLALVGRRLDAHVGTKVGCALTGVLTAAAITAMTGTGANLALPVWAAVALGAVLWFVPDLALRKEATQRRRDARLALSAFANVIELDLAGGKGLAAATALGAEVTSGWLGRALRLALRDAERAGSGPGPAMHDLGQRLGLDDLVDLAANISLAGKDGATARASLAAKAAALRDTARADLKAESAAATEKAAIPLGLLAFATLALVAWPALARIAIPH